MANHWIQGAVWDFVRLELICSFNGKPQCVLTRFLTPDECVITRREFFQLLFNELTRDEQDSLYFISTCKYKYGSQAFKQNPNVLSWINPQNNGKFYQQKIQEMFAQFR